ncbi:WD40-repeat-containing domain protein [Suillus spraguei]|nr:WD40-repeat-containing domain protein [Suillus spraguei]
MTPSFSFSELHEVPFSNARALPFVPTNSSLSKKFSVWFPNTLRVALGRAMNWPAVQIVLMGHTGAVWSVSFSPDGTRIVTGSSDSTVRLWDAGTGEPVGEPLRGHTDLVLSVSFSPDGTRIVTSSQDRTVRLWDAGTRQPSQQHQWVGLCCGSADSDPPVFSDDHCMIEATTTMTLNTWNNYFIRFSSNSTHALCDTSGLKDGASHDDRSSTPFFLNRANGWVAGPKRQLLFWVPHASRHLFYSPGTTLVIPRGGPELDLSRMAHEEHWQNAERVSTITAKMDPL